MRCIRMWIRILGSSSSFEGMMMMCWYLVCVERLIGYIGCFVTYRGIYTDALTLRMGVRAFGPFEELNNEYWCKNVWGAPTGCTLTE